MTEGRRTGSAVLNRIARHPALRLLLLLVLATLPVSVYAAAVAGLTVFTNGTVADANEMNANFAAVATAVDDNDARIAMLEALPDQQCAAGTYAAGIDAAGDLICEAAPPAATLSLVSTPLPSPWTGATVTTPSCPAGTTVVGGGITPVGLNLCGLNTGGLGNTLATLSMRPSPSNGFECSAAAFDSQGGSVPVNVGNCDCFAACQGAP